MDWVLETLYTGAWPTSCSCASIKKTRKELITRPDNQGDGGDLVGYLWLRLPGQDSKTEDIV